MHIGDECPNCVKSGHTGVWNGERFMVCSVCGDKGIMDKKAIDIMGEKMDKADSIVWKLEEVLQSVTTAKQEADDGEVARRWAIVKTELEKVLAFTQYYLVESEK